MKSLALTAVLLAPVLSAASPSLDVGQPFPIVSLPLCGNETEQSSILEFRGRKLMLHLFASW